MRALLLETPGNAVLKEVPEPELGEGALVSVKRVGVCGTDLSIFRGKIRVSVPRIMGHEAVGVVERPGRLGLFPPGTRVVVDPTVTCGHCDMCRADHSNLCRNGGLMGREVEGVFAERLAIDETLLHAIPDQLSLEAAPLLQVLATCVHAQSKLPVFPGDTGVVIGLGVTGSLHLQLLAARGLSSIVVVTRSEWKQRMATGWGATHVVGPEQAAEAVVEASGGRGANVVIESAGYESTLRQAIELAAPGGTVLVFGTITGGQAGLPYYQLYAKELTLLNPRAALPRDFPRAIELVASRAVSFDSLVTHRFSLDEGPVAMAALAEDTKALKMILEVS
jgi:2-desacetyl-2-hydroxyethyl bacteriochlorophyllide A dehydrogenase